VKVFLDECVDWRLARDVVGHDVKTARQMGWTTVKNGALLSRSVPPVPSAKYGIGHLRGHSMALRRGDAPPGNGAQL
jgi:hypothetical protein